MRSTLISLLLLSIMSVTSGPAFADGGGSGSKRDSQLTPFKKLIDDEKYEMAISELKKALGESPDDADLLNLLAYSQRKLMRFDEALVNYQKALEIEPEHRGANEYLGELYLQLGQLDDALERLQVLDDACFFGCGEFDELEEEIKIYRSKNSA
jgi:tetratricopeptide (TPR) repeat protein